MSQNPIGISVGSAVRDEDEAVSARPTLNVGEALQQIFKPRPKPVVTIEDTNPGAGSFVILDTPAGQFQIDPDKPAIDSGESERDLLRDIKRGIAELNDRDRRKVAATVRKFNLTAGLTTCIVSRSFDRQNTATIRVVSGGPVYVNPGTNPATTDDFPIYAGDVFEYDANESLFAVAAVDADVRVFTG